jgi:tRNA pseudouridine38-40 synthase
VHATGQVAHCDLARDWDPFRLSEALNWHLKPAPVAITACARVAGDFHARFSAVERRYLFRMVARRAPMTLDRGLVWQVLHRPDLAALRAGRPPFWSGGTISPPSAARCANRTARSRRWTRSR